MRTRPSTFISTRAPRATRSNWNSGCLKSGRTPTRAHTSKCKSIKLPSAKSTSGSGWSRTARSTQRLCYTSGAGTQPRKAWRQPSTSDGASFSTDGSTWKAPTQRRSARLGMVQMRMTTRKSLCKVMRKTQTCGSSLRPRTITLWRPNTHMRGWRH